VGKGLLERRIEMLVEIFSEMVQIDSESGEEERFINYLN